MRQVGCASASSTETPARSVRPRKGPPEAVRTSRSIVPGGSAADQLEERRVLGVDRQQPRPGRLGERHRQLAADHQALLVGEGDVDPLAERDDRRAEAGGADDAVEDEVGARAGDQLADPLLAGEDAAVPGRARRARRRPASARATAGTPWRLACSTTGSQLEPAARPTTSSSSEPATISSAWAPIDPVQPRMTSFFIQGSLGTAEWRSRVPAAELLQDALDPASPPRPPSDDLHSFLSGLSSGAGRSPASVGPVAIAAVRSRPTEKAFHQIARIARGGRVFGGRSRSLVAGVVPALPIVLRLRNPGRGGVALGGRKAGGRGMAASDRVEAPLVAGAGLRFLRRRRRRPGARSRTR